jgi:2-oxoglutarate ferredoxin oxidoreductase subunit gamma
MITKTAFAGSGGQGVLSMGYILAFAAMKDMKNVTYLPSYGAEVRGGTANCTVCISDEEIASPVASAPDFAVVLNKPSMIKFQRMIKKDGIMLVNSSLVDAKADRADIDVVYIPANKLALELGNERAVNMIMMGAFAAKTGVTSIDSLIGGMSEVLKSKNAGLVDLNKRGLERGAEYASNAE